MAWTLSGNLHVRTPGRLVLLVVVLLLLTNRASCSKNQPPYHSLSTVDFNLGERSLSPTVVCKRWSQQSKYLNMLVASASPLTLRLGALVNGTLYLYGGRAISDPDQTTHEWNNDFLALDLSTSWEYSAPALKALPKPSGPPKVANGYLWASFDSFFLYGGEFSDSPPTEPAPVSIWEYQIAAKKWIEYANPVTSQGQNAPGDAEVVLRAAEGAGFSVAALGKGWYFGGHEDQYTIPGWTYLNGRVYLTSLLEYTFPGYSNTQIYALSDGSVAGSAGAFRNVTQGALAAEAGFPERADGILVWVPGFGAEGILIGVAGGTNDSFTQTNIIDVYDVATSSWYKQATTGPVPKPRVNPCAVVAAAADGSSYNVYLFGGQNLQPAGDQTQYNDMWILSIPTFTWIPVPHQGESVPPGRSGHTCNVWDGQMVLVGGQVGESLSCDSPGIYVFDLSALQWVVQFSPRSNARTNPQSKQSTQTNDPLALQGSYSYRVPAAVQAIVGGGPFGQATMTRPSVTATSGPIHTGKPKTYPIPPGVNNSPTKSGGGGASGGQKTSSSAGDSGGTNVGAIVAGVVAGVLFLVLLYLIFVAIIYRKRLAQYKRAVGTTPLPQYDQDAAIVAGSTPNRTPRRTPRKQRSFENGHKNGGAAKGIVHTKSVASLAGHEPSFIGIMMSPRRSLRITNPD